jgi:hypothetical protein
MGSEALTFEEAGLADHFLMQAFDALMATGDAKQLRIRKQDVTGLSPYDQAVKAVTDRRIALDRRMEFARAAVLWTALAVEAGANFYIAATLPGDEALDDLRTVNKLLVAPRLATGEALFETDKEPIGQLRTLFSLRNRIVHPKVGRHAIVGKKGLADFTPRAAGECLIAAARALSVLARALPEDVQSPKSGAELVLKHEGQLRAISRKWTEGLPQVPPPRARLVKAKPPRGKTNDGG